MVGLGWLWLGISKFKSYHYPSHGHQGLARCQITFPLFTSSAAFEFPGFQSTRSPEIPWHHPLLIFFLPSQLGASLLFCHPCLKVELFPLYLINFSWVTLSTPTLSLTIHVPTTVLLSVSFQPGPLFWIRPSIFTQQLDALLQIWKYPNFTHLPLPLWPLPKPNLLSFRIPLVSGFLLASSFWALLSEERDSHLCKKLGVNMKMFPWLRMSLY